MRIRELRIPEEYSGKRPEVKRLGLVIVLMALIIQLQILTPESASARGGLLFGNLQSAETVGDDTYSFGASAMVGDNITNVYGTFTYGIGMFSEARLKLGIADLEIKGSDPTISFGAEYKYQFWNYTADTSAFGDPVDLAFSGMIEYASFDEQSVVSYGANVIASRPFYGRRGKSYGPYGRFNVRMTSVDPAVGASDTDIEFALSPGFFVQLNRQLRAFGEFTIDDNSAISFGFEFGPF